MKDLRHISYLWITAAVLMSPATQILKAEGLHKTDTLPEISVIAAKEEKSHTSSTPFHDLTSGEMLRAGVTDISDALTRMPGINIRDYGGAGGLKTVSVRGLGAVHTGIAYDGIPLSDLRSGEIDLSRYSLNNISALSLSSGDYAEIFIPARLAATASMVSVSSASLPADWEKALMLTALIRTGSFGLYNPYLCIGYSDRSRFAISASADFTHAKNNYPFTLRNGQYTERLHRENSRMNSITSELNATWTFSPSSRLSAKVYWYDTDRRLPGPVIYYLEDSNESLRDRNFFTQLQYRGRLSSKFSILGSGKFNWSASRYIDVNGRYPGGRLDQSYLQREYYASAALLYLPFDNLAVDYSADWVYNNLSSNLVTDTHPYRNSLLQSLSAQYKFWRLTLMARGILSLYSDRSDNRETNHSTTRFSPSISASVRPIETVPLYIRASYKNILRMPTFNELYFDNYGSVNLDPEITNQYNIGFTYSLKSTGPLESASATIDGYVNEIRNKIVAIPYNLFRWTMTNLGKVRVYGLDMTLDAKFSLSGTQSLLLAGSYSYQRAMPVTSSDRADWKKQVAYTPLNSGSASMSWLNPWVSMALSGSGASSRYTTNTNLPSTRIAGYFDFGLSAFHIFSFRSHSLELRADLINLLDKQYEIVARYPMPGRSWQASVKFSF